MKAALFIVKSAAFLHLQIENDNFSNDLIFLDSNRDSNGLIYGSQTGDQLLHTGGTAALHLVTDMSVGFQRKRSRAVA